MVQLSCRLDVDEPFQVKDMCSSQPQQPDRGRANTMHIHDVSLQPPHHRPARLSAITPTWVQALFDAALSPNDSAHSILSVPCDPRAFALTRLLHAHEAVHRAVDAEGAGRSLQSPDLAREFPPVNGLSAAALARVATTACGAPMRIRTRAMRLAAANPFAASFVPPAPGDLPKLLLALDAIAAKAWRRAAVAGKDALRQLAYAEYFALLAIHPLPDGNGRTARAVYASRLWHAGFCDERMLLAIPMTFSGSGARFHLAAQLARTRTFADLFANWRDALHATERAFAAPIAGLRAAVARDDVAAVVRALESMRQTLIIATA